MKTDDLIQQLSSQLKPVRPMTSPLRMVSLFAGLGFILIIAGFAFMSRRPDLQAQFKNPQFLFEVGISIFLAFSALALAAYLSRPGLDQIVQRLEKITVGILALVLVYDGYRIAELTQNQIHLGLNLSGVECFSCVAGYALLLGTALIYWLRQGASINPHLSGLVIGTAGVALGNISITFFCDLENAMHSLVWHFTLPIVVAAGIGFFASRTLLKW
jgi:hypothetical protein